MQVLNGGDFDQKNILIGGGETEAYGVTNDPVLMGMLSTGLYQKPMRTMIQETLFNAWDAHRMGKCQDTPIDIYINDTSGLIVRDYGPGIHKKEIHPIYCIYGNSTKRDDDDQTGGFGLGSKSPYAYTDSFTVTSHHEGHKAMYVMNRVSEKNDGGPGRSIIFEDLATEETGLIVTIPLKNESDQSRALMYVQDILYLSGIKAKIHYLDDEPELIESESLAPGKWVVSDDHTTQGYIWAVYGGVRYSIIHDDAYSDEYNFVRKMADMLGTLYIGFKPSSLSPLPSREGLNLNERTVEAIKTQLEVMEENFRAMLHPVTRVVMNESFKSLCESGIEPKYLVEAWRRVGDRKHLKDVVDPTHPVLDACYAQCPDGMNQSMWNSICVVTLKQTDKIESLLGDDKMDQMKYIIWAKKFPDHKHYRGAIMLQGSSTAVYQTVQQIETPKSVAELITAKEICDKATGFDNEIRVEKGNNWYALDNIRKAGKLRNLNMRQRNVIKALGGEDKLKKPDYRYPDQLWFKRDGEEYSSMNLTKTVILSKTLSALNDTEFSYQSMFTLNYPHIGNHHNFHRSNFGDHYYRSYDRPVAAIVVHQKKGGYDKALQALRDAGYTVHEADEPERKVKPVQVAPDGTPVVAAKRGPLTYPLYSSKFADWADYDNAVTNPTCYVTVTEHKIHHSYTMDLPNKKLLQWVADNTPRFVILHNKNRATRLQNKKIPSFEEKIDQMVDKIFEDKERMEQMKLYYLYMTETELPPALRDLPEMLKFFHIPHLRNSEKEKFLTNMKMLDEIRDESSYITISTRNKVRKELTKYGNQDVSVLVRKRLDNLKLFHNRRMDTFIAQMKPHEVKSFSEKLIRFLRTV